MPDFCAAFGCSNRRCLESRVRGITFHQFPKCRERRRRWEIALRRKGFVASDRALICSAHFRDEDFDRTGQTVRLKDGVVPTIFNFPAHLQRVSVSLTKSNLRSVGKGFRGKCKRHATDHSYALLASPKALKAKLDEMSVRVSKVHGENSNALRREKRAKNNMQAFLEELREKNLINEELKYQLECYSGTVSLAAQTLSNSVAVALRTLRDVGYAEFRDFEATSEFIQTTDRLFDVFNSRKPRAKGFKPPLGSWNWASTREFLLKAREFLRSLKMEDGKPLYQAKRSYKKMWLMARCGVASRRGNVTAQDATESLTVIIDTSTSLSAVDVSSAAREEDRENCPFADIPALLHDHSYLPAHFSGLVENALVYISGKG
ncbi:hypothetical protein ACEWY4_013920 [Coilia grayii]|uniref:THAP-type domain-containing protein n=1 Tax=Coilia grayii TaxID=363190 RepID=A0ABD1JXS2_9TELE